MKLRLIWRANIADSEGRFVCYDYHTVIVEVPNEIKIRKDYRPEIVGGEWIEENE